MPLLQDLCEITSGVSFRESVTHEADGDVGVIRLKDVDWASGTIAWDGLARVKGLATRHHLHEGDILFAARGLTNRAVLIDAVHHRAEVNEVVAASPFFVLRSLMDGVLPAFVSWYLNTAPAQAHIQSCACGTNMPSVTKGCLSNLSVPVPHLDAQHRIVRTNRVAHVERDLVAKLIAKRCILVEAACLRLAIS